MNERDSLTEEDKQWILDNPLPDSPGLFAKSPLWFKHSAYEVKEYNDSLYICPKPGATVTYYKPFEKYPQIMTDFMTFLLELDKLPKTFTNFKSNEEFEKLCKKREYDYAELLLEFTANYGPLGIMFEYVESIEPSYTTNKELDFNHLVVVLNRNIYSKTSLARKMLPPYTNGEILFHTSFMKYEDFCSYFLPTLKGSYPQDIYDKEFMENYAEMVNDTVLDLHVQRITRHMVKLNEFVTKNHNPEDIIQNRKWSTRLKESFGDIGLAFNFNVETNKWDLNWDFKSLIGALSIMYVMNITGKMGASVHKCKYSKCDKIVIDRNCCCVKHDNAYRKAKERARKEKLVNDTNNNSYTP